VHEAWTKKYKPQSVAEVVGNKKAIAILKDWLRSWEKGVPQQRAAFLYGPAGVGKTSSVEALASDLDFELMERNASDYRTEEKISQFAGLASQYDGFFGKHRIILLDEMDGIYGTVDRGAIPAVTRIIQKAQHPLVLIANDYWNKKFAAFRNKKKYLIIEFKKPSANDVLKHLKGICQKEKIAADENALNFVAQRNEGDVRAAINDLQSLAQGKEKLTYEDVSWLAYRDRKDVIFSILRLALYGKTCNTAKQAADLADVDLDMLLEWMYENTPYHFNVPSELADAMEALAKADLYRARIRRTQNWKLLRYVIDFMTAGVAMARRESKPSGWIPFRFPQRIKSLSASRAERMLRRKLGRKMKRRIHTSVATATGEVLPYLKIIFKNDLNMAANLAKWFEFSEEEINYVAGSKKRSSTIMSMM
jgi:replication factor C large subunit